jgi:hypothetical protein
VALIKLKQQEFILGGWKLELETQVFDWAKLPAKAQGENLSLLLPAPGGFRCLLDYGCTTAIFTGPLLLLPVCLLSALSLSLDLEQTWHPG